MAKKIYLGDTLNKARKVKKGYFGDTASKARKVKKGYIGVGGVARPFFSGEPSYYGTITSLSAAKTGLAATSVGDYALFGGGANHSGSTDASATYYSSVDAYNSSLTKSSAPAMSYAATGLAAAKAGSHALFGGGTRYANGAFCVTTVNVYDASLTKLANLSLSHAVLNSSGPPTTYFTGCQGVAATTVAGSAIFAGGMYFASGATTTTTTPMTYINSSLVKSKGTDCTGEGLSAVTVGNRYALFFGGGRKSKFATIVAYNLVSSSLEILNSSVYMSGVGAVAVGDYAVLAGGYGGTTLSSSSKTLSAVYAVSSDLVVSQIADLPEARYGMTGVTLGQFGFLVGGASRPADVIMYDANLMATSPFSLSEGRSGIAAAVVGDYALLGGGMISSAISGTTSTVEAISA